MRLCAARILMFSCRLSTCFTRVVTALNMDSLSVSIAARTISSLAAASSLLGRPGDSRVRFLYSWFPFLKGMTFYDFFKLFIFLWALLVSCQFDLLFSKSYL